MINPVFLQVGKISIRWYGICTALGLLAGYFLQLYRAKRYSFTKDMVADLTFFCMLAGVLGARMAYVLRFWQQEFAGENLLRIFMDAKNVDPEHLKWYVIIHMTFVVSAFAMGYLDKLTKH